MIFYCDDDGYYIVWLLVEGDEDIFYVDDECGKAYCTFNDILTVNKQKPVTVETGIFRKKRHTTYENVVVMEPFVIFVEKKGNRYYELITKKEIYDGTSKTFGEINGISFYKKAWIDPENVKENLKRLYNSINPQDAINRYIRKLQLVESLSMQKYNSSRGNGTHQEIEDYLGKLRGNTYK